MRLQKINVGLFGLGRLGKVYAHTLAGVSSQTRLVAVADTDAVLAEKVAASMEVPRWYVDPFALLDDKQVDAVVIASPTSTHKELVEAAASRHRAIFCEKPLTLSLADAVAMNEAVARSGVFFQMGFMRRFDAGYVAAKLKIEQGVVGTPIVFKSTSRDAYRTTLEYADPQSSGGMIIDMGIHDFDLARWLMGEIKTVYTIGGTLAFPELRTVGDIDNAIISLGFVDGGLGVVDLSRSGVYGYDISTEILGTAGTLRIGYLRETPLLVMTKNHVAHDTVPFFVERFADAYVAQLQNFAENLLHDRQPPITIDDGIQALRVGVAATRSYQSGQIVDIASITTESI